MSSDSSTLTRDQIASMYLEQLPYEPYPVQENALLSWFTSEQGVLVCAPTGTGKTLIAEAALFEALHTDQFAYYTTPLIALTDQKFREMQAAAVRWGFSPDDVGLATGNRRVNPDARVMVVVAEILLNRLLHPEAFDFSVVSSVVMDEFHNFNDRERGIVWEFTLGMLPSHIRTLLLSATVGNAQEFVNWLEVRHDRKLDLVQGTERKVPLTFEWVGDKLLTEQIENMAEGGDEERTTPALVFCFNRDECWTVAEQLKGKGLLGKSQRAVLADELEKYDWSQGAGPKLKQILLRGVGVHHAGVLPKYRRIVEDLFQRKLLAVCVCTETLAAGVNLPARSVVLPTLLKGPPGEKKLIEPSSAHQMFGRAGRPQFDKKGYVFALAHEDDVKIDRWREKCNSIPESTKDPNLIKKRKSLEKKMPKRRSTEQYWNKPQFEKLIAAPPSNLFSRGPIPWRMLAYMLSASPEVELLRKLAAKRLLDAKKLEAGQKQLNNMLITLWKGGYVTLEPPPPIGDEKDEASSEKQAQDKQDKSDAQAETKKAPKKVTALAAALAEARGESTSKKPHAKPSEDDEPERPVYKPMYAYPTPEMDRLVKLRGVNPLYGVFLVNQLGVADRAERIQALESVLELPGTVARFVRVPSHEHLPPGPLATTRLDVMLLQLGLVSQAELGASEGDEEEEPPRHSFVDEFGERKFVLKLAEKLRMLFNHDFPNVHDIRTHSVWAVGELLLEYNGDFNKYILAKGLQKQEGVIFRHLLRFILLTSEFAMLCPPDATEEEWQGELYALADQLTESCRRVDPSSTDEILEQAKATEETF